MKHLLVGPFFTFLFISINVKAQLNHFIYVQADNKQPFYVRQDKNVYSSTATGYLVLAKLKTGSYELVFGFPKNEWPEQNIHCVVEEKDLGYLLKNFGDKGWGLFNLQSLNVLMANENGKNNEVAKEIRTDAFSNMLSTVVNDPTIKENESVKQEAKKIITDDVKPAVAVNSETQRAQKKNTSNEESRTGLVKEAESITTNVASKNEEIKKTDKEEPKIESVKSIESVLPDIALNSESKKQEVKNGDKEEQKIEPIKVKELLVTAKAPEIIKKDVIEDKVAIIKRLTNKSAEGLEMVYVDFANGNYDTIRILIPIEKKQLIEIAQEKPDANIKHKKEIKAIEVESVSIANVEKNKEAKFLKIELPNPNLKVNEVKGDSLLHESIAHSAMINSDCKNFATNEDFLKLRKKMAAAAHPEDMIMVSKKAFKTKCFTTEQLKNLSVLFLNDSGKYSFFDAAYPFVSDSQNYKQLENQLAETYYIKRFRVMVKH